MAEKFLDLNCNEKTDTMHLGRRACYINRNIGKGRLFEVGNNRKRSNSVFYRIRNLGKGQKVGGRGRAPSRS